MSKSQEEWAEQQRRDQYHSGNLQGAGQQQGEAAQVLSALSDIDDLPIKPQDDPVASEEREPLHPKKRAMLETLVTTSKLALSRSEGAKVIEEGTRDVSESVLSEPDSNSGGGGLLAKVGLK